MPDPQEFVRARITIQPTPFAADPPYASQFYEAMGRAVVLWGKLEFCLDNLQRMVIGIAAPFGIRSEPQISLTRKTKLIRQFYAKCPGLKPDAKGISDLMAQIDAVAADRNLMIHSLVERFEEGSPPSLLLRNVANKRGRVISTKLQLTLDDIASDAEAISNLQFAILMYSMKITQLQPAFRKARRVERQDRLAASVARMER
jgi:hypothetical protein